ncbi:unnamed protein product [Symbiodinium microadriaticum]|nr:unnamed protein product [Symbiodinium microadriaticum]
MVTFSLHGMDEVLPFSKQDGMDWKVHAFRVANPRWDAEEQCRRSVAHTMVITQKAPATMPDTLELEGVLSNEDYEQLLKSASEIVDKALFTKASVVDLISCLDFALHQYASTLSSLGTEKKIVDTAE